MKNKMYFPVALLSLVLGCSDNASTTVRDMSKGQDTPSSQVAPDIINENTTKRVLDHHWEAFIQNNLDEVIADYTEEAVLITPDATFKGLAQIKKNFEDAYKKFPKAKTVFQLNKQVIDRDVAYILWQAKTPAFNLTYATDTFIKKTGKSSDRPIRELVIPSKSGNDVNPASRLIRTRAYNLYERPVFYNNLPFPNGSHCPQSLFGS